MSVSDSITKKSASNLAMAFVLLPRERAEAMSKFYAFCRQVDDIADEDSKPVGERKRELDLWRHELKQSFVGQKSSLPVIQELQPVLRRYQLSVCHFEEILDGVEMDLMTLRYPTFEALDHYCYHVASAVGLVSIEIFGYSQPACRDYAIHLGKALQITNILRDVRSDAERGRIYIPGELMREHGVDEAQIFGNRFDSEFQALASALCDQAQKHFREAVRLLPIQDRQAMIAAELMGAVYWALLRKIKRLNFNVLGDRRIRLSKLHKLYLILQTKWINSRGGHPSYASFV